MECWARSNQYGSQQAVDVSFMVASEAIDELQAEVLLEAENTRVKPAAAQGASYCKQIVRCTWRSE